MTVTVEPTPTVRAGADGWFIGGRMPNVKSIGWAIYAAGFAIWLFGYLSTGHVLSNRLVVVDCLHRHALMTMIAYAFLQHRRLIRAKREKKIQRATAPADIASRAPHHPMRSAASLVVTSCRGGGMRWPRREQSCCRCHAQYRRVPTMECRTSGTSNGRSLFVDSEIRSVRGDVAATAKHHARHPPDVGRDAWPLRRRHPEPTGFRNERRRDRPLLVPEVRHSMVGTRRYWA